MGGGGSKIDTRYPTVIEDPYPPSESIDGISIAGAENCGFCELSVNQNISTSSVKLRREYGTTSVEECGRLANDIQRVKNREMAFDEFKRNLQNAKYLRPGASLAGSGTQSFAGRTVGQGASQAGQAVGRRFCERVMFDESDAANIKNMGDYEGNQDKLRVLRIQEVSSRAYSSETKLHITPSIPFAMKFLNKEIQITRMTLYHPCPVRLENKQYDAVLSLNDPVDNPEVVILIPIEGVLMGGGKSAQFFSRLVSYVPGILLPNANGEYESIDVPTGSDWSLTNLIETAVKGDKNVISSGYFIWQGQPTYEQYISEDTPDVRRYSWRPSGRPSPGYFLFEKPLKATSMDLMTLQRLPMTPPAEAIHPIPKRYFYRPYQCPKSGKEKFTVEKFTDECDPFKNLPESGASSVNVDMIISILIGSISLIALIIGVYFGLKYGTEPAGEFFKRIGERIGRAIGGAQAGMMKAVAARAAVIEAKRKEAETKKAEEALKPKESGEVKKADLKKDEEFAFKNPMLERRKTARKPVPEIKDKPKDTTGIIKEDELKPGEEFAFKNPLADRRKTARKTPVDEDKLRLLREKIERRSEEAKKKEEEVDKLEERKKELKAQIRDTSLPESEQKRVRSEYQKITGEYIPTKKEQEEAAGVGPLKPKKRIIQSSDRELTAEQKAQAELAEKQQKIRELDAQLEKELRVPKPPPVIKKTSDLPPAPLDARKKPLSVIKSEGQRIRTGDTQFTNRLRRLQGKGKRKTR